MKLKLNLKKDIRYILVSVGIFGVIASTFAIGWLLIWLFNQSDPTQEIDVAYSFPVGFTAILVVALSWAICECCRQYEYAYAAAGHRVGWRGGEWRPLVLVCGIAGSLACAASFTETLGYPPHDEKALVIFGSIFFVLTVACFWVWRFPVDAWKIVHGTAIGLAWISGGIAFALLCLAVLLSGYPGLSKGWQQAWWKRLLDILTFAVWLVAAGFALLLYFGAPFYAKPPLWQPWLVMIVPTIICRGIRRMIVFVVDGPAKAVPAVEVRPPEKTPAPRPALKLPEESQPARKFERPGRGGGQFLPAS